MNYAELFEKKNLTYTKRAKKRNDEEYVNTFMLLLLRTLNCFEWVGMPETCNARMLEMALIMNGTGIIAKTDNGYMTLISTPDGSLNVYGDPVGAYGYGLNGYNKHFNLYVDGADDVPAINKQSGIIDAVMCKDNELMYPFANYLRVYASRIADTQRSLDVVARMLKAPAIITCDERDVQNVKKVLEQIDINTPYILGIGALPYDTLKTIDTGVSPESLKVLYDYLCNLNSQASELIGVNSNPEQNKRERMLVDEINVNNADTSLKLDIRLKERQAFCKRVNDAFGLNISVKANAQNEEFANNAKEPYNDDKEDEEINNERNEN